LYDDGKCSATVSPCFVSKKNPLAHVNDVFNAITVKGDAIGNAMFYGPGAGKLPTASAVVADIIDCVKHLHARKYLSWDDCGDDYIADHKKDTVRMYVRLNYSLDSAVMLDRIKALFGEIKLLGRQGEPSDELAFITPFASEEAIFSQLGTLKDCTILAALRLLD
jgi:homoserine dehydrogenase